MPKTLERGKHRYLEGEILGIIITERGDNICSSQLHPQSIATSTGSHLVMSIKQSMSGKFFKKHINSVR